MRRQKEVCRAVVHILRWTVQRFWYERPFLSMNTILLKNENRTWRTRTGLQTFLWFWLTVPVSGFVYVSVVQGLGWNSGRRTYILTELSSGTKKHCQCIGSPGVIAHCLFGGSINVKFIKTYCWLVHKLFQNRRRRYKGFFLCK